MHCSDEVLINVATAWLICISIFMTVRGRLPDLVMLQILLMFMLILKAEDYVLLVNLHVLLQ